MALSHLTSFLITILGGFTVIVLRLKSSNRPASLRKIIIPPAGMSTGLLMFLAPETRIPWLWALAAFVTGAFVFSLPLIRSTKLERAGRYIILKRSKAFMWIIIGMLAVRVALHDWVERYISVVQTAGLFYLLAFGMIVAWRLAMLRAYLVLRDSMEG
jgi:membrane protein CcdC involved in cytochrome C biogenesis